MAVQCTRYQAVGTVLLDMYCNSVKPCSQSINDVVTNRSMMCLQPINAVLTIDQWCVQLVASASIFIASKLVDPCPIAGCDLVKYTDNTYQLTELLVRSFFHPSLVFLCAHCCKLIVQHDCAFFLPRPVCDTLFFFNKRSWEIIRGTPEGQIHSPPPLIARFPVLLLSVSFFSLIYLSPYLSLLFSLFFFKLTCKANPDPNTV